MILELIKQPWSWYFSGIMIVVVMLILLFWGKSFGFSANLRTMCTIAGAGKKVKFFDFDWKTQKWNLFFLVGSVIGGFIASNFLTNPADMELSANTIQDLQKLGISFNGGLNPSELFSLESLSSPKMLALLLIGGVLVGFGARYAGGCTSGHAISGLSNLQVPSLIAVVGFFIGGLVMTFLIMPLVF
ncbi:YeeE/YedE family protein [Pedobacter cryophilus]|uniref:YeeE/YedE family protein n=1 Tax=Pedobacter cryophilus TaxID=2571271 RepID=A0A4U1BYV8_9SPHI|nr:YeeE/YedE thiosulfate transporter family protein [Pedobacter cryophilus]TKB97668.1 YeeE/YedE family protein [Pedobacter cryophilus]